MSALWKRQVERHEIGLPLVPESTTKARHWVETKLGARLSEQKLYDARLVVSELVTNAVLHSHGRSMKLELSEGDDSVEIAVRDDGSGTPQRQEPAAAMPSGRGLLIVDKLSEDWGAVSQPSGKVVWARLRV
jgi:anti-sigma regulatory factor (Ser/Thr protein kinase)